MCALDLCPIDPSVYRSDFLELQVTLRPLACWLRGLFTWVSRSMTHDSRRLQAGEEGSALRADEGGASSSCRGDLVSLPRGSFDVVLMSLVLSYLPHPLLRTRMVLKVRPSASQVSLGGTVGAR